MEQTTFLDGFEGGTAEAWDLEPGWRTGQEGDRQVLRGSGHGWARLRTAAEWADCTARFRVQLLAGGLHLNYRVSEHGRYVVGLRRDQLYLNKESPWGTFLELEAHPALFQPGTWYEIEIVGQGSRLRVSVDGARQIEVIDRQPLTRGSVSLETLEDSSACVDEVRVTASDPNLDEIVEANLRVERYAYRLEVTPGVIFEGQVDLTQGWHNLRLGPTPEPFPQAEAYWMGETGYGRRLERGGWLRLRSQPLPNFLHSAARLLQHGTVTSGREEGPFWVLELQLDHPSLRVDPDSFLRAMAGDPQEPEHRQFVEQLIELTRSGSMRARVQIRREDLQIARFDAWYEAAGVTGKLALQLSQDDVAVLPIPDEAVVQTRPGVEIPMSMLLMELPKLGGWCTVSHGTWAQRTIDRIEKHDKKLVYAEIYDAAWMIERYTAAIHNKSGSDPAKHHPLILGSIREDCTGWDDPATGTTKGMPAYYDAWFASDPNYKPGYFFSQTAYGRDHHHYGGEKQGLEHEWYMDLRSVCPPTTVGDRYYSARDWGFGGGRIDPPINRLTFTNAIEQYYRYSVEGKRNAYLMLGHVIHLLQDCGQPDHARVAVHIASSLTGADVSQYYCPILAAEAAALACLLAGPWCLAAFLMTFAAIGTTCALYVKAVEVGYENLVEHWDSQQRPGVESQIDVTEVAKLPDYDAYFHGLSQFAHAEAKKRNLPSPLGCATLWLPPLPPVPSLKPNILPKSPKAAAFLKLTDALVPQIIAHSAGLIQLFYKIVNYPPILERVAIVQWEPADTPRRFAAFKPNTDYCVRYHAYWKTASDGKTRTLTHVVKPPPRLSPDHTAYIFLQFGPSLGIQRDAATGEIKLKTAARAMAPATLSLRLTGTDPDTGASIDQLIGLTFAQDPESGPYYWGSFEPRNCSTDPYWLTLVVQATDDLPHLASRSPNGSVLDANPAVCAQVEASKGPKYPWRAGTYGTGPDQNHKIQVHWYEEWQVLTKPDPLVLTPARSMTGEVELEVQQKAHNCQWEPYWGPPTCPVTWELLQNATKQGYGEDDGSGKTVLYPDQPGTAADFGFTLTLDVDPRAPGRATLTVATGAGKYTPGTYELYVKHTVGKKVKWIANATVRVELQ